MTSWSELPLTEQHAAYLREQAAITADVAAAAGIRSASTVDELPEWAKSWGEQAVPAIVFPWRSPDGTVVEQVRPDIPAGDQKYLWPKGVGAVLNTARAVADAHDTVLIVEGTKQTWTAAAYAPGNAAVYGIGGCRNWSADGIPLADLGVCHGRRVVVALDADSATNPDVYTAGLRIGDAVRAEGAASVAYLRLPVSGTAGMDDVLARRAEDDRAPYLERLITLAKPKPADTKPRARGQSSAAAFFDESGALLTDKLARAIQDRMPAALTEEQRIALYRNGVFNIDKSAIIGAVSEMLADRFRPGHRSTVEEYLVGVLFNEGLFLPVRTRDALLNVRNGMLDLATGTLKPHDPAYLSSQQIPIDWDPDATCPTYEFWADSCGIARQLNDLEETASTMLDPSRTPSKAVFLFGPSRSGKSTFLRLMQNMVGSRNLAAVTLHQLSQNRFAAANVFGKMLNCAADLSSAHVDDISIFKMMTGEDPIQADRKYGGQFAFTNRALFAFSANELPTVGESSRAYTERIKPFEFAVTFAGRENPDIEARMIADELSGILVRWVQAWQRRHQRGTVLPTDPKVMHEFEVRSDRVRQWLDDRCAIWRETADGQPVGFGTTVDTGRASTKAELAKAFNFWAEESNGSKMGQRKIIDRLMTVPGVTEVRRLPGKVRALNVTVRRGDDGAWHEGNGPAGGGGSSEGPSSGFEGPSGNSGLETATASSQVEGWEPNRVAEVAISSPPYTTSRKPYDVGATEGDLGGVSCRAEQGGLETATSATSATRTIARPDLDRVEKALAEQGIEQPGLLDPSPAVDTPAESADYSVIRYGTRRNCSNPEPGWSSQCRHPECSGHWRTGLASEAEAREAYAQHQCAHRTAELAASVTDPVTYTPVDLATWSTEGEIELSEGTVVLDIEGASAQLWPLRPDAIRITGVQQGKTIRIYSDAAEVTDLLRSAKLIVGHNLMGFDLVAFAVHHGVDIHELAARGRLIDTMLTEVVVNPPEARTKQGQIMRSLGLDALGEAKQLGGKTHDLGALAKEFGGYGEIPIDDERYVTYCAGDVNLTAKIGRGQSRTPYAIREHRVAAIAAQIRMNGFRVDRDLLAQRVAEGEALRKRRLDHLQERYGLPLTKADGKPCKAPHATKGGKTAIARAFEDLGVELGTTKSGGPAFGKEAREVLLERYADRPEVVELLDTVGSLLGIRTVYATVERCLVGDRVHPNITMFQASGRWSITEPGLTVMGKRGGKHIEREIFLPEPGHVIIAADLSQVDARAVAAWCQDPAYLELFGKDESGQSRDSHTEIAMAVWGDAGRREEAKVLGHGWNYGMGIAKLAAKIGDEDTAREFDRAMKERYPLLVQWKQDVAAMADSGELLDNGFGRLLRTTPGYGWTQGPALMGQSAARDILMEGLLRMPRELYPYLRAVVHDEIVMSIPEDRADEIEAQVMEALSFPWAPREGYRTVNIEAGLAKRGLSWGACYAK